MYTYNSVPPATHRATYVDTLVSWSLDVSTDAAAVCVSGKYPSDVGWLERRPVGNEGVRTGADKAQGVRFGPRTRLGVVQREVGADRPAENV